MIPPFRNIFTARCYAERGYEAPRGYVVRLSMMFTNVFDMCWYTSKIILRLISLRFWLGQTPTSAIWLTDDSMQSTDKDQQQSRAVTGKPYDVVVKLDTYRNLKRHRTVLPAIARLSCLSFNV